MTMMILDGLLILVIGWGVLYAWRTSAAMQTVKNEMKPVTRQLGSYLNTIGQHLQQLRETTEMNRHTLSEQLPQAKVLREDFEVLLDHGTRLADRLDALLEQAYVVERELRGTNAGVEVATSQLRQAPVTRETIRHRPYSDVMQQTPVSHNVVPPQQVYAPAPQPPMPPAYAQAEDLEIARSQAMQARSDLVNRLRGIRL